MPQIRITQPQYAAQFQCIGPACEDTCCRGWNIHVEKPAYDKYHALPAGPLREMLVQHIAPVPQGSTPGSPGAYGRMQLTAEGSCPLLTGEGLCRIHAELGPEYLCHTCAQYPRVTHTIDTLPETSLLLSCPEAARLVLLNPGLPNPDPLNPDQPGGGRQHTYSFRWEERPNRVAPLSAYFWAIRDFCVRMVRDRRYALWQRLFLLGVFTRRLDALRLDALTDGRLERGFPEMLADFSSAVDSGGLSTLIESIQPDAALQLSLVLMLLKLRLANRVLEPRLRQIFDEFMAGIGNAEQHSFAGQLTRYQTAYAEVYEPFFAERPGFLENYLLNQIFATLFPFGRDALCGETQPEVLKSYTELVSRFALLKGVLIGVAGHYGAQFSLDHAVRTVQVVTKFFDHNPQFIAQTQELLKQKKKDDARGLTMLLRN